MPCATEQTIIMKTSSNENCHGKCDHIYNKCNTILSSNDLLSKIAVNTR